MGLIYNRKQKKLQQIQPADDVLVTEDLEDGADEIIELEEEPYYDQ